MNRLQAVYPAGAIFCIILAFILATVWNGQWTTFQKMTYAADILLAVYCVVKTRRNM